LPAGLELDNEDIDTLPIISNVNVFFIPCEDSEFEVEPDVTIAGSAAAMSSSSRRPDAS
jgi:hypothetical protein